MGVLRRIQILSNLCKDNLQVDSKVANGCYSLFSVWFVTVGNNLKSGKNEVGLNLFESQWELSTSLPSTLLRGQETGTSNVNVLSITRGSGSPNFIQEKLSSFLSKNDCVVLYLPTAVFILPSNLVFPVSLELCVAELRGFPFLCLKSDLEYNNLFSKK